MAYKIYDQYGNEQDRAWLEAKYGDVRVITPTVTDGKDVFRVIELREKYGPAALVVQVRNISGAPMNGVNVIRYAACFDVLPQWTSPPERYADRGVYGPTNENGDIGFGMGTGDYYLPPDRGFSGVSVGLVNVHSDYVDGLGMLPNTEHAHLDTIYQMFTNDEPEPPTPPTPPSDEFEQGVLDRLDMIIDLLQIERRIVIT